MLHQGLAASTRRSYGHDLELFARWCQDSEPGELDASVVARYRESLASDVRLRPATVQRRIESLRRFLRWAAEEGHLPPGLDQGLASVPRARGPRPEGLGEWEVQALLEAAAASGRGLAPRNVALVEFLLGTGLRVGELVATRVRDVTLRERTGSVRVSGRRGTRLREVPLSASVRRSLAAWLGTRGSAAPEAPLFTSERDGPLSARAVQHLLGELARRARLEPGRVTGHALRHTYAVRYLRNHPGDREGLARLLGHDSLDGASRVQGHVTLHLRGHQLSRTPSRSTTFLSR